MPLGLLGTWGEWHHYPHEEWFASKTVQIEVMDAYASAFRKTRVLARYPTDEKNAAYAPNHRRAIGYHDDSFACATLDTGRSDDSWFFQALLLLVPKALPNGRPVRFAHRTQEDRFPSWLTLGTFRGKP